MKTGKLAMLGLMFGLLSMEQRNEKIPLRVEPLLKPKNRKLPKGVQKYYFDFDGNLVNEYSPNLFYQTESLSESRAKKKFDKFIKLQLH